MTAIIIVLQQVIHLVITHHTHHPRIFINLNQIMIGPHVGEDLQVDADIMVVEVLQVNAEVISGEGEDFVIGEEGEDAKLNVVNSVMDINQEKSYCLLSVLSYRQL